MDWTCSMQREKKNEYKVLIGKFEESYYVSKDVCVDGRIKCIKMDL
jgi:hypothetical protein